MIDIPKLATQRIQGWASPIYGSRLARRSGELESPTGPPCGAGVSGEEAPGPLHGEELIANPMVEWTRGVTVHAAPEQVWSWLIQTGYGRGGWYTPQWVDLFANRWVFGIQHPFPAAAGCR